ncbi:MAG: diaminopimelate epimerase [Ruminococcus sp.]|nr:diaminopimelate epimerase [Ruminococcus sp.]
MKIVKMQAYGNDYLYINTFKEGIENPNILAKKLTSRHYGLGSDGLVLISNSDKADFRMRIFNPDGTEAEMCGNALRSVGKYVYDLGFTNKKKITIETLGGIKYLELIIDNDRVVNVKANIGKPIMEAKLIPVNTGKEKFIMEEVKILDKNFRLSTISLGNPHTVLFVDNLDNLDIDKYGPAIENNLEIFPKRTNVTFAQIVSGDYIKIREWERGTGETIGCATGASSAVVVANYLNKVKSKCKVEQIGGFIDIELNCDKEIYMMGPSHFVYNGDFTLNEGEN